MPVPLPAALAPGLSDHVCHAYGGPEELRAQARPSLAEGIALGQRPLVVTPERDLPLAHEIARDVAADPGMSVDVVELGPALGPRDAAIDAALPAPGDPLVRALDQGFSGLRAVARLTHIATEPFLRQA